MIRYGVYISMFKLPKIKIIYPLVLVCIVGIVALANFVPGTYLTGWDNLHPEFNFLANIKRAFFGVWQEYQGLGTIGGMGLAADLPRQIILFIASVVVPNSILRYAFHFSMLGVGAVGAYLFIKDMVLYRFDEEAKRRASFLGALFYLFNLATVQMFYVPFEPFSAHFGFLPWLFYANIHFVRMKDQKSLLFLFLINLLAVMQNSVATFFYVYLAMLAILLFVVWRIQKRAREVIIALIILISVNAFWLFPNIYYVFNKTGEHIIAKTNLMATEDDFLMNKKYGNLQNSMLLKGFWFDNKQLTVDGKIQYQMGVWREHLQNPFISAIGYSLFIVCVLGIFIAIKKRLWGGIFLLPIFLISFTILSSDTPVFSFFASLFYKLPLFAQIFRFPFTKFAVLTAFLLSMYFAVFSLFLFARMKQKRWKNFLFFISTGLFTIYCFPIFSGKFFYDRNRLKIPQEYFAVFDFFKNQNPNERIANFPQTAYWEWTFYQWNYTGAGILWNGIAQPTLDRAFDAWGKENENYYHEVSYAVYSGNAQLFRNIVDKYQIRWLLIDESTVNPNSAKATDIGKLREMISKFEDIQLVKRIGTIEIYQVSSRDKVKDYLFLASNPVSVNPYQWNNNDVAFEEGGNYISKNKKQITDDNAAIQQFNNVIYYPFRSLFTGRRGEEKEFQVEDRGNYFAFTIKIDKELEGSTFVLPQIFKEEITELDKNDFTKQVVKLPTIYLDDELIPFDGAASKTVTLSFIKDGNLEVRAPKVNGYYSYDNSGKLSLTHVCDDSDKGEENSTLIEENSKTILKISSLDRKNCLTINLPEFSTRLGYLLSVESRNIEGKSLLFWIENINSRRGDLELYLRKEKYLHIEYFIQPPMEQFGLGYTLHFDNISIGRVKTVNDLGRITVNPIPYRFLTGLKIVKENSNSQFITHNSQLVSVDHPNPSFYQIGLSNNLQLTTNNQYLVLSQSYDDGWHAYQITNDWFTDSWYMKLLIPFFQPEIKDHVLVNNWENGWRFEPTTYNLQPFDSAQGKPTTIVIVYLPQYLEYFGFLLLGGISLVLFLSRDRFPQRKPIM